MRKQKPDIQRCIRSTFDKLGFYARFRLCLDQCNVHMHELVRSMLILSDDIVVSSYHAFDV